MVAPEGKRPRFPRATHDSEHRCLRRLTATAFRRRGRPGGKTSPFSSSPARLRTRGRRSRESSGHRIHPTPPGGLRKPRRLRRERTSEATRPLQGSTLTVVKRFSCGKLWLASGSGLVSAAPIRHVVFRGKVVHSEHLQRRRVTIVVRPQLLPKHLCAILEGIVYGQQISNPNEFLMMAESTIPGFCVADANLDRSLVSGSPVVSSH